MIPIISDEEYLFRVMKYNRPLSVSITADPNSIYRSAHGLIVTLDDDLIHVYVTSAKTTARVFVATDTFDTLADLYDQLFINRNRAFIEIHGVIYSVNIVATNMEEINELRDLCRQPYP